VAGGASKGAEHVATRGVRGRCALSARGRQRRGTGGAPSRARRYRSPPGNQGRPQPPDRRERERNRSKRVERRQARHGPACSLGFASGGGEAAQAEAHTGNRAIVAGARDVGLVAEVGEEHPPRSRTAGVERRQSGLRGSVRRSFASSDGGGAHRSTRIGASKAKACSDTYAHSLLPRSQGRGPSRWKASWVVRTACPKPARGKAVLAKR
jgi:hypothetical protein